MRAILMGTPPQAARRWASRSSTTPKGEAAKIGGDQAIGFQGSDDLVQGL